MQQIQTLGIDIESDFITKDNIDRIWEYIKSINVDIGKVFYLHFILDKPFKEISKELEINESTIRNGLYRMLKNIRKAYLGGEKIEK